MTEIKHDVEVTGRECLMFYESWSIRTVPLETAYCLLGLALVMCASERNSTWMWEVRGAKYKVAWRASCCDVLHDQLPCVWISSRRSKSILIKINIEEFNEKLLNHFRFHLDWKVLTTTLHKTVCAYFSLPQLLKRLHNLIFSAPFDKLSAYLISVQCQLSHWSLWSSVTSFAA